MPELNLRNRSGYWIETNIAYNTTNEKGVQKEIKEKYVVEAIDFGQAEERIRKEMNCANRQIKILSPMVRPKYGEICFADNTEIDTWFKVKVIITEEVEIRSRKGGVRTKTKAVSHFHLIQATTDEGARRAIKEVVYKDSTADWEISDINKTRILGVLEREKHLDNLAEERAKKEQADADLKK
jgi:hypothetical protein